MYLYQVALNFCSADGTSIPRVCKDCTSLLNVIFGAEVLNDLLDRLPARMVNVELKCIQQSKHSLALGLVPHSATRMLNVEFRIVCSTTQMLT